MSAPIGLTEASRSRPHHAMERRELAARALVDILFVIAVALLLAFGLEGDVSLTDAALLLLAAVLLGRLEFEIGGGFTVPTQLVFVPMLFVLPPAIVPVVVALATTLDRLPEVLAGRLRPIRMIGVLSDAWFAVGPALVFVLFDVREPSMVDWPIYLLALAAQFAGDLISSTTKVWLGQGIAPRLQIGVLREIWLVDLLLSPIGLLAAFATVLHDYAYLLVVPLAALLARFARDRHERIGQAIELSNAYRGTALLLGDVLGNEDEYTGRHSKGVVEIAMAISDELRLGEEERRLVEFGAMLHDIGKIATPNELINKPGKLTDEEWVVMKEHTVVGQQMLDRVGGALHDVGVIVRSSHESYDGNGYPDGLIGEAIPLASRIVAVADAYSAMTTRRSYREPMGHDKAVEELLRCSGTQFDPAVVAAAVVALDAVVLETP